MKNFYKIACGSIVAGLIFMGVGGAISICEVKSFNYMGDKYNDSANLKVDNKEIIMPDNLAKIFYYENNNLIIEIDDGLEKNNVVLTTSYLNDDEIEIEAKIYDDYYLYNNYLEKYSEYTVNLFEVGVSYYNDNSGFQEIKDILNDLKNKEIYNYNNDYQIEYVLKVSKEDYDRLSPIPEGYSVHSYGSYMSNMEDMRVRAEAEKEYEYTYEEDYNDEENYYDDNEEFMPEN